MLKPLNHYVMHTYPRFTLILFTNLLFLLISPFSRCQEHVNRNWIRRINEPLELDWSRSILGNGEKVIHVGNTIEPGEGANLSLTVFNSNGTIDWSADFHTSSDYNDYGISVLQDANDDIYVLGTTDNGTTDNYDIILLKYSSTGNLIWSDIINSNYDLNDVGTDIILGDNEDYLYVSSSSESSFENFDLFTLKYDNSGNFIWKRRYDYNSLVEIPTGIKLDKYGKLYITTASGSSTDNWDYTIVRYDLNGDYLGDNRHAMQGIGFDQPLDFTQDTTGNIYITGRASSTGSNYDIRTIKLNENYGLIWSKTYDFAGNEDVGTTIQVDDFGNVYVGGYVTKSDFVRNMTLLKYDSNGNLLDSQVFPGKNLSENAEIRYSEMNDNNECYFLFNEKSNNNIDQCGVLKIDTSLAHLWIKKIRSQENREAVDLNISNTGNLYASIAVNGSSNSNEVVKFSEISQNENFYLDDSLVPFCKENELIVRFKGSAIDSASINNDFSDNRIIEFGELDYFLTSQAMSAFNKAIEGMCSEAEGNCDIVAVKLFKHLKTYDTTKINRLGDTVRVPDFWSTFLLLLPEQMGVEQTFNALNNEDEIIAYCEPNLLLKPLNQPDDQYYSFQHSLESQTYPNADIEIEEAWDIFPAAGLPHIRCGVYDQGIDVYHEDFGYDGVNLSTTKVRDGWDFEYSESIFTTPVPDYGHGTPVAGIIGAIRDNSMGVAGIAGGSFTGSNDFSDKGTSLYALKIFNDDSIVSNPIQNVYDAIVSGSMDDTLDYTFGLHTMNNSWRIADGYTSFFTDTNITLLREATHFANRMNVTFVASRGNEGNKNEAYPAVIDDDWILSVGGSGNNGLRKTKFNGNPTAGASNSSFGREMDVIAPASSDLITTTKAYSNQYTGLYSMTSAAAPHVAGLVTLLQSYLNDTVATYENLAPEDCEHIIEITSVQVDTTINGYDEETGWGLINAAKTLRRVEKPWNEVLHFGTNQYSQHNITFSQVGSMEPVYIKENIQNSNNSWFLKGDYQVNIFKVDATVQHQFDANDTIVDFWDRPSMSNVFEPIVNDTLLPRERVEINSLNRDSCTMSGYLYEVFDNNGNPLGWLPHDTIFPRPRLEYTVLVHDSTSPNVGLDEQTAVASNVQLFPNPSTDQQTIKISNTENKNISVQLFDMNGRLVQEYFNDKVFSETIQIDCDIRNYTNGVYIYNVYVGDELVKLKSIKY